MKGQLQFATRKAGMFLKRLARLAAVGAAVALTFVAGPAARAATQIAAGCDAAHPTFIGGTIEGYPDSRAVNALIGIDMIDATGQRVDTDGRHGSDPQSHFCGGYGFCGSTNHTLGPQGSTDPNLDKRWGSCVAASVQQVFVEAYPKDSTGKTNFARYGAAANYYEPITAGTTNLIAMRLPVTWESAQGPTGWVNGYITFAGHKVPTAAVTRVRAFTHGRGPECGVEGFSASATDLGPSASLDATFYKISYLAGGRCGATSQSYTVYVDCTCGGRVLTQSRVINITSGRGIRVDFAF